METGEKNKYLEDVNNRIYEQLSFAEAKNGVLIGLYTAMLFGILAFIFNENVPNWLQIYLSVVSGILLIGLIVCVISFIPNTKTLLGKKNMFFWGDIARIHSKEDYIKGVQSSESLYDDLAEQNIHVSRLVKKKNLFFSISVNILLMAIFPLHIVGGMILIAQMLNNK